MDNIELIKNKKDLSVDELNQLSTHFIDLSIKTISLNNQEVVSVNGLLIGILANGVLSPFPRFRTLTEQVRAEISKLASRDADTEARREKGSGTAKKGFQLETLVVNAINQKTTQGNHIISMLSLPHGQTVTSAIETSKAKNIAHNVKSDIYITTQDELGQEFSIHISQKLVSQNSGFNQLDKRWVDTYAEKLNFNEKVTRLLKFYTGELSPIEYGQEITGLRDQRRIYFNEMLQDDQDLVLSYFNEIKEKLINFLFCGDNIEYAPQFFLLVKDPSELGDVEAAECFILPMDEAMKRFYSGEEVAFTSEGNLKIGHVSMQRKGGDSGRPTANMLQFKINPAIILK